MKKKHFYHICFWPWQDLQIHFYRNLLFSIFISKYVLCTRLFKIKLMNSLLSIYKKWELFFPILLVSFKSEIAPSKTIPFLIKPRGNFYENILMKKKSFSSLFKSKAAIAKTQTKAFAAKGCAQTRTLHHLWSLLIAIRATCYWTFPFSQAEISECKGRVLARSSQCS